MVAEIEKLKKARKPIRSLVTRTCNEVEALLTVEELDMIQLTGKYTKLKELNEKIQVVDNQILDLLIDTDDLAEYEDEVMEIDKYYDDITISKIKIDRRLHGNEENNHQPSPPPSECVTVKSVNASKRRFKLPKIELKKFSGKLLDWLSWWSQFEKIHTDDQLHTTDKFDYLKQSMENNTRAKEIVDGFPATEENYAKAINAIKERFGKTNLLTQVYVRELFQLGINNMNKKVEITTIYDKLICHVRALESLGVTLEQSTLFLYPMVESSLPEDTLIAWQRSSLYEKDGSKENPPKNELDFLFQFLQQEVEHREQRNLVKVGYGSKEQMEHKKERDPNRELNISSAAGLFNGQSKMCIFCDRAHQSRDCGSTECWSIADMKACIQKKGACFHCLKTNHLAKDCKSFIKCHVCSGKHQTVTCPDIKKNEIEK